jgi:hypothetical protein
MWTDKELAIDWVGGQQLKLVEPNFPAVSLALPPGLSLRERPIEAENIKFSTDANIMSDNFSPIIPDIPGYVVELRDDSNLLGQIVSVGHGLQLRGVGSVRTVISTFLLVTPEHQHKKLAAHLIRGAINEGRRQGAQMGYHWIRKRRTASAIVTLSWYRPLNIAVARRSDYGLDPKVDYSYPKVEAGYEILPTTVSDFENFESDCHIRLNPTDMDFLILTRAVTFITIRYHNNIVGIVGYRPFPIIKPFLGLNINSVLVAYYDSLSQHAVTIMTLVFKLFKSKGYTAAHGVFMSSLSSAASPLAMALSDKVSVDFYNLAQPGLKISKVALLYI